MKIYITRNIPVSGINKLKEKGFEVEINPDDRVLSKEELIKAISGKNFNALFCLLTDKIDKEIIEAAGPQLKIIANLAVGFDNIDVKAVKEKNIFITNTPEVLTKTVAEHAFALMLAISCRIVEADKFTRSGKFKGWEPMLMLGSDLFNKVVGVVGLGRIGQRVAFQAKNGFDAKIIYHDIKRSEDFEKEFNAVYKEKLEDLLKEADYVSLHVPLLPSTRHLINQEKLALMKPSAYLINTSRGAIIDEEALTQALKNKVIAGAALDVFENEPRLSEGLTELDNVILTPHIASASVETRSKMAEMAAENIIAALGGQTPPNSV